MSKNYEYYLGIISNLRTNSNDDKLYCDFTYEAENQQLITRCLFVVNDHNSFYLSTWLITVYNDQPHRFRSILQFEASDDLNLPRRIVTVEYDTPLGHTNHSLTTTLGHHQQVNNYHEEQTTNIITTNTTIKNGGYFTENGIVSRAEPIGYFQTNDSPLLFIDNDNKKEAKFLTGINNFIAQIPVFITYETRSDGYAYLLDIQEYLSK